MAEGRQRESWWHTAYLLSMLHNINRPAKTQPVNPIEYHPMEQQRKREMELMANPIGINILKIFIQDD
ncbi:MAG: hypothetical protein ACRC2T_19580 [Thermoguttaceae bacterium]